MTHFWTQKYNNLPIFFCTAHPGWADTPAVRTSMPDFYSKFHNQFRTPQQGADTIIWGVVSERARKEFPNGSFFEDRKAVIEHLPMSGTKSTDEERELFVNNLKKLVCNDE